MTNGDPSGTRGERAWLLTAWAVAAAVVSGVAAINVLSIADARPELGVVRPAIWEASSAIGHIASAWLPLFLTLWSLRSARPRWQAWGVHLPAALAYSVIHVAIFLALRHAAYATMGDRYDFGPLVPEFLDELPKDVLAYALIALTYFLVRRLRIESAPRAAPELFDIRDGARLVRAPIADILAVSSAGNYAEFVLADGRKPLMRSSLSAIEKALAPRGFVRTHRSWLVNASRVTGLRPEGSGDYAVELAELTVPLSRRFPEALARLRQG